MRYRAIPLFFSFFFGGGVKQLQEERRVKHLVLLSLKDGQRSQTVYNEVSNH